MVFEMLARIYDCFDVIVFHTPMDDATCRGSLDLENLIEYGYKIQGLDMVAKTVQGSVLAWGFDLLCRVGAGILLYSLSQK
jgi:hypothetical protein